MGEVIQPVTGNAVVSSQSILAQGAGPSVTNAILGGQGFGAMRTNDLLRHREWVELDTTVVQETMIRLRGVQDLINRGLVRNLGGLGTLIAEYEQESEMTEADVDMSGEAPGEEDTIGYNPAGVPVPIIHKDFRINIRRLLASRRLGDSLDTTQAGVAGRRVAEKLERLLVVGHGTKVAGYTIYGYTTHPNRITGSLTSSWDQVGPTPQKDVSRMIAALQAKGFYGPYMVYVGQNYWMPLQDDYKAESDKTTSARILEMDGVLGVQPLDQAPANTVIVVQMTPDVVQLQQAEDISTVEWNSMGGMVSHYKVMTAAVALIKSTADGKCGVAHYSA